MTKFQWEQEMNRYLSALPKEERSKILEYYGELFLDKFENGEREEYIIACFGEPKTVALDIIKNYDSTSINGQAISPSDDVNTSSHPPIGESGIYSHTYGGANNNASFNNNNGGVNNNVNFNNNNGGVNSNANFNNNNGGANNNANFNGSNSVNNNNSFNSKNANNYNGSNNVGSGTTIGENKPKWNDAVEKILKIILFSFLFLSVGIPVLATIFSLCVALLSVTFSLATCSIAGVAALIAAIFINVPTAQSLVFVGMGAFLIGLGIIFIPLFIKSVKLVIRICKTLGTATKKILSGIKKSLL